MAVKIINKEKARKDPYVYKNLRREGRLLQRGHHKHVISIYDTLGKIYWLLFSMSFMFNIVLKLAWFLWDQINRHLPSAAVIYNLFIFQKLKTTTI